MTLSSTKPAGDCKFISKVSGNDERALRLTAADTDSNTIHVTSKSTGAWTADGYECSK
jgi:hypothetical protein